MFLRDTTACNFDGELLGDSESAMASPSRGRIIVSVSVGQGERFKMIKISCILIETGVEGKLYLLLGGKVVRTKVGGCLAEARRDYMGKWGVGILRTSWEAHIYENLFLVGLHEEF